MQATSAGDDAGPFQRAFQKLFKAAAAIEPREFPAAITAFFLFFCVLGGYFAVRPVRETVGTIIGEDRTAGLFTIVWVVSVLIIPVYGYCCSIFKRSTFLPWVYGLIAAALAIVGATFLTQPDNLFVSEFFFVMISVVNLFVVSVFWSFLLELFDPAQTKRLFPAIAVGGTVGALVMPAITALLVPKIGNPGILFLGAGLFLVAIVCQRYLLHVWRLNNVGATLRTVDAPMGGNPFNGLMLILKSPYLLGIASFVFLLACVNTVLYFQQLTLVNAAIPDREARTQLFGSIDFAVQALTLLSQVVISGRVAKRWGVIALITFVPLLMVGGFLALAATYSLASFFTLFITRRVGEYAFVRPGREMLFAAVGPETKYKAKNTIDVPVYRGGDAAAAAALNADSLTKTGLAPQAIALIGAGLAAVWAVNGYFLGRKRERMEVEGAKGAVAS